MLMAASTRSRFKPRLAFILLCILLITVQIAGGASRAEVFGQSIVRGAAWLLLIVAVLFCDRPDFRAPPPIVLLIAAAIALPLLQLIPLPPSIWTALPGRDLITHAAVIMGEPQPWRPWAIVPAATVNAASSLIVPTTALWLTLSLNKEERERLLGVLLCLVLVSTLVGLVQISNFTFDNPLINETPRTVSGTFANRNHFALQMAIGCAIASAWAFASRHAHPSRVIVGFAFVLLFMLAILVSGSRAGLLLGSAGLMMSFLLGGTRIKKALTRYPRWVFPALVAGTAAIVASLVFLSIAAGRAVSIDRLFAADPGQGMRARGLPTLRAMLAEYFPFGSGLGGFDPIFRIHEPFHLLKPTYFNHAHNDLIEVVIDAGLPGLLLLLAALCWWGWASVWAWGAGSGPQAALPKLGSTILLLVLLASTVDYPARTPTILAWAAIAAVWLSGHSGAKRAKALPDAA
jgi:O-antigen ligase